MKTKRIMMLLLGVFIACSLFGCSGSKTKLYYIKGNDGSWCMVLGCGNRITSRMEECAEQPSVEGNEIEWIEIEIIDGAIEIPKKIDGAKVTDIECFDYTGSKNIEYILLPIDAKFEVESEWLEELGDVIFVVEEGSTAERYVEEFGHDHINYDEYED